MALKHDAQGFLTGDPIDIGRALDVWDDIHDDVRAIRHALTSGASTSPARSGRSPGAPGGVVARPTAPASSGGRSDRQIPALLRPPATPQIGGTGAQKRDSQAVAAVGQAVAAVRESQKAAARAAAKPASRDGRGRFVARGGSGGGDGRSPGAPGGVDERDEAGGLRGVADRIAGAIKESGSGMEEADPAIKAFNEVAQPMARGYELLTGGNKDKRQEGWLRRIWTSLTGLRNDETTFNKAANKSLKAIEEKPEEGSKGGSGLLGGLMGGLGGMLTRIPVIGPMLKGAGRLLGFGGKEAAAAAGGAGAAGKEVGLLGKTGGLLKEGGILSKAGGLLKRIPLLGTLLSVGGAAADIYDSESDDSLTRRDKDKRAGKAVGGAAGSLGGMAAGAAAGAAIGSVVPVIGTAIGGIIGGAVGMFFGDQAGQILGDKVGGWVNDLREADIPGKIASAWQATTSAIASGWDATTKFLRDGWDSAIGALKQGWETAKGAAKAVTQWASDKANTANDLIKDNTGIDIKSGVVAAKDKAVALGGQTVDTVKAGADWAAKNTTAGKAVSTAWDGAKAAGSWMLGQTSKLFESGKGGAATVSSGKGDNGGASYGTYQLSSSQGTLQKFLKSSKYGDQFAGMQPGSPEFNAKWKEVAKADPEFGNAQHDFIKTSHFDPAMSGLKDAGIDLSGRSAAVQDALWSTSVQFGAGSAKTGKGAVGMFQKALAGRDVSTMSDQDIVGAIQDYKIANNDKLFASSSAGVRAGTANRAAAEKEQLLALAGQPASTPTVAQVAPPALSPSIAAPAMPSVVASASAPSIPALPSVPAVPSSPPMTVPMTGGSSDKPIQVSLPSQDVGQDLRDRPIAHIVTGGLS